MQDDWYICKRVNEIMTNQIGIRTRALWMSSQVLYQLSYLRPVFEPVWRSHIIYFIYYLQINYKHVCAGFRSLLI